MNTRLPLDSMPSIRDHSRHFEYDEMAEATPTLKSPKLNYHPLSPTMARAGEKTQKQVQFLCPKMNHLSVDEKFSMRTLKVTKKFRFLCNKGVVHDDGTNTSFYN